MLTFTYKVVGRIKGNAKFHLYATAMQALCKGVHLGVWLGVQLGLQMGLQWGAGSILYFFEDHFCIDFQKTWGTRNTPLPNFTFESNAIRVQIGVHLGVQLGFGSVTVKYILLVCRHKLIVFSFSRAYNVFP